MAKSAAKKVKKKSPAKKTPKAKAKKAVKKPTRKKSNDTSLPNLKTCLRGKRLAIAGSFIYPKSVIEEFFTARGANITKTINAKLDILLVSRGPKKADQTKAEKLNSKGEADIRIANKIISVFPDFELYLSDYIATSTQFRDVCKIMERTSTLSRKIHVITGVDFSKKTIGPSSKAKVELHVNFKDCRFNHATIQNTQLGNYEGKFTNCEMNEATLNQAHIIDPVKCKFEKCKGSLLNLSNLQDCELVDMMLDKFEIENATKCSFANSKFQTLAMTSYNGELKKCELNNVKAGKWTAENSEITNSKFSKVHVAAAQFDHSLKCINSTFRDCKFSGMKTKSIDFHKCELINCTFDRLKTDSLNFCDKTKLKNCRFIKPDIGQIAATKPQLTEAKGIPKGLKQFSPTTHPKLYSLAKTIVKSERFQLSLNATYNGKKTVHITCEQQYGVVLFSFDDPKVKKHSGTTDLVLPDKTTTSVQDVFRCLGWLMSASQASEISLDTIKTKVTEGPKKAKALKELVIAAMFEGVGQELGSAEEIKSTENKSATQSSQLKKTIKAELMAGEIKKFNRRPASERTLACPIRKVDFSGVNLAGAKLAGFIFRSCNFSKANLSKVDFSKAIATNCDFTKANLTEAKLTQCDLTNSVLNQANMSKAVLSWAKLSKVKASKTNFANANFGIKGGCDYLFYKYQLDLSTCNLTNASFVNCSYTSKTTFPKNFPKKMLKQMVWYESGPTPDERN